MGFSKIFFYLQFIFYGDMIFAALPSELQKHNSLHELIRQSNVFEVRRLLQENARNLVNKSNRSNKTPLQVAAELGDNYMIKLLLEFGAFINARTIYGTALSVATLKDQFATVQLLLERGADVNIGNTKGQHIPLVHAVSVGNELCVELFLQQSGLQDVVLQQCINLQCSAKTSKIQELLLHKQNEFLCNDTNDTELVLKRHRSDHGS